MGAAGICFEDRLSFSPRSFLYAIRRSEENPEAHGLSLARGTVTRFTDVPRVPQIGWNRVVPGEGCRLVEEGYAYFANSYRLTTTPRGWECALADYGGPFVAAMERGPVLACQFHPELSGAWGLALLRRWLRNGGRRC